MLIESRAKFDRHETRLLEEVFRWARADFAPPSGAVPITAIVNGSTIDREGIFKAWNWVEALRNLAEAEVEAWTNREIAKSKMIVRPDIVKRAIIEGRQQCVALCVEAESLLRRACTLLPTETPDVEKLDEV